MAYDPLDPNVPSGTDPANTIDDIIRRYEAQVAERMADITGNPPDEDGWANAVGTDDEPLGEFLLRLKSSAIDDATGLLLLERTEDWSAGLNSVSGGNQDIEVIVNNGLAPSGGPGGILNWRMPLTLPIGSILQNYKSTVYFEGTSGTSGLFTLAVFKHDIIAPFLTSIVALGTQVNFTAQTGLQVAEIAPLDDLDETIVAGFTYWADITIINGSGAINTIFYNSSTIYDSPGVSKRF